EWGEGGGGVVGSEPVAVPAVSPRDGAAISRCTVASDDERDRVLEGTGVGVDVVEVDEATVVFGVLVVPQRVHRIEVFVGHRAALGEVGAEGAELRLEVAGSDAEHDATARQDVGGSDLLGDNGGVGVTGA